MSAPTYESAETCLDVWLRFHETPNDADENGDDEPAEAEANTYRTPDGYRVEWYLNAVGLVKSPPLFDTYAKARAWLTDNGFQDFTS